MTRVKKPVMTVKTIEDAEAVMAEYAIADAKLRKINAKMDEQITAIRQKYADEIQEQIAKRDNHLDDLHLFAESNPQLFEKKKSLELTHGLIGFRTGTPKLKLVKKMNWQGVLELLKLHNPHYVRTVEEPAKDKLLADREDAGTKATMLKCGVEVVQEETFYIEPKQESQD